ncbi:hypothetical protein VP1G_04528 [Cytospora mali]|uniref:Uncharacterized protein n=1 Tax=Cytospora mali TaxID=578113 RepID=A0A194UZZ2_CYTMA|nr:hypothetical protein VP1G_04528 [Valsa mali var. pyri (nom. inval.)]
MSTFFSRLLRPRRARGQLHAPPARGQAEVNALLDPNSIAFDDFDNFILVIQEADPQARGLGILGGRRPAPAATSLISPSPPDTASLGLSWSSGDDDFDAAQAATSFMSPSQLDISSPDLTWSIGDHDYDPDARMLSESQAVPESVAHTDSSRALTPPASLLVENSQPEAPSSSERSAHSSYASSYYSARSQGPFRPIQWGLVRNLGAVVGEAAGPPPAAAAAGYDSDATTLVDQESDASPPDVAHATDSVGDVGAGPSAPYEAGVRDADGTKHIVESIIDERGRYSTRWKGTSNAKQGHDASDSLQDSREQSYDNSLGDSGKRVGESC